MMDRIQVIAPTIPAKAGIQGELDKGNVVCGWRLWVPACAGTTGKGLKS